MTTTVVNIKSTFFRQETDVYKVCGETNNYRHGQKRQGKQTPEHRAWMAMKTRCMNPNAINYADYGFRGIQVCARWLESFENFYEDMGDKPGPDYTLDRIDPYGDYTPENCRWADKTTQALNTKKNTGRMYDYD